MLVEAVVDDVTGLRVESFLAEESIEDFWIEDFFVEDFLVEDLATASPSLLARHAPCRGARAPNVSAEKVKVQLTQPARSR